jgi:hypothetical protein
MSLTKIRSINRFPEDYFIIDLANGTLNGELFNLLNIDSYLYFQTQALAPWLAVTLSKQDAQLAPDIKQILQKSYKVATVLSLNRISMLGAILKNLSNHNISVIMLKGCYLEKEIYEAQGMRLMTDTDLLVKPEDFQTAGQILEDLGYKKLQFNTHEEDQFLFFPHVFQKQTHIPNVIDLHRTIRAMDYYRFDSSYIWEKIITCEYLASPVCIFPPEINFIHVALHALNHSPMLRDWLDLFYISKNHSFSWDKLSQAISFLKVEWPLSFILHELHSIWKIDVPQRILRQLEAVVPGFLEKQLTTGNHKRLFRIFSRCIELGSFRKAGIYAMRKLF